MFLSLCRAQSGSGTPTAAALCWERASSSPCTAPGGGERSRRGLGHPLASRLHLSGPGKTRNGAGKVRFRYCFAVRRGLRRAEAGGHLSPGRVTAGRLLLLSPRNTEGEDLLGSRFSGVGSPIRVGLRECHICTRWGLGAEAGTGCGRCAGPAGRAGGARAAVRLARPVPTAWFAFAQLLLGAGSTAPAIFISRTRKQRPGSFGFWVSSQGLPRQSRSCTQYGKGGGGNYCLHPAEVRALPSDTPWSSPR